MIADLEKLINKQNLSYTLNENNIPISKNLVKIINSKKLKKFNMISNGDDYQVLFTASPNKTRIILDTSRNLGIKITKIGKINSANKKSSIIGQKGKKIVIKNKGHTHKF